MSKVGGLQFSRPVFDWESKDKLTELSQFKADCEILFTGPLCDLKEKQRAGLLINWLGRQATQIIASSTDNNVDSPEAVFEILEKVFSKFCGKSHDKGQCPAYGKICNNCGRKNHFESKCQSAFRSISDRPRGSKSKSFHKCGKCGHKKVDCVEYSQEESGESDSDSSGIKDLTDQVHSLFYH